MFIENKSTTIEVKVVAFDHDPFVALPVFHAAPLIVKQKRFRAKFIFIQFLSFYFYRLFAVRTADTHMQITE